MREYIVTNKTIGKVYRGENLVEVYKQALIEGSPYETITVKSMPVKATKKNIDKLLNFMIDIDPNGMWDEDLSVLHEDEVISLATDTLNQIARCSQDSFTRMQLYSKIMEFEAI